MNGNYQGHNAIMAALVVTTNCFAMADEAGWQQYIDRRFGLLRHYISPKPWIHSEFLHRSSG